MKRKEERERERQRVVPFAGLLTEPQMPLIRAKCEAKGPKLQPDLPHGWKEQKHLGYSLPLSQAHYQQAQMEAEQQRLNSAL